MTHASKQSLAHRSSPSKTSEALDAHRWAVRLFPGGELLAAGLHRAEAQGFARAWNRIEGEEALRARVVVDRAATERGANARLASVRPTKRRSRAG